MIKNIKNFSRPFRSYFRLHNKWTRPFYGRYFGLMSLDKELERYIAYKNGFFVELGASDGISQSNTKYFELFKGWKGILIEPYEPNYKKCKKNRKKSTKSYHAACVPFSYQAESVQLIYSNLMTVTSSQNLEIPNPLDHALEGLQFLEPDELVHIFLAPAKTLNAILEEAGAPKIIDLLSLDVEGFEIQVLRGLDHQMFRFKYICIEARNPELLKEFMDDNSYSYVTTFQSGDMLFQDSKLAIKSKLD